MKVVNIPLGLGNNEHGEVAQFSIPEVYQDSQGEKGHGGTGAGFQDGQDGCM